MEDDTCAHCGESLHAGVAGRRYCGRPCYRRAAEKRRRLRRAAERAKERAERLSVPVACQECGVDFVRIVENQRLCSETCRREVDRRRAKERYVPTGNPCGVPVGKYLKDRRCSVDGCGRKHLARGFCPGHYKGWRRSQGFVDARSGGGSRSAKAAARHVARAKRYGVPWERFDPVDVFERDDWTCGLCGDPVDPDLEHPDPMSVSLDHIVPIIQGGGHLLDNCQCSHLTCNLRKARGPRSARIVIAA